MSEPAIKILWAEDNIGDILLIKEAFKQTNLNYRLNVLSDGEEAINFITRRGRYTHAARPDLIILDLNLPKKSGREIISEIKADPTLANLPLVVLTSSSTDRDVLDGLEPKRCLYLLKPLSFLALVNLTKQIHEFWLSLSAPKQEP